MNILKEQSVIPDSYKITVTNYHLAALKCGYDAAERLYRKRISALTGWIFRKKPDYLSYAFIDICLEMACDEAEKLAKELHLKNPKYMSIDEHWGIV